MGHRSANFTSSGFDMYEHLLLNANKKPFPPLLEAKMCMFSCKLRKSCIRDKRGRCSNELTDELDLSVGVVAAVVPVLVDALVRGVEGGDRHRLLGVSREIKA